MGDLTFEDAVRRICEKDGRFDPDAYFFVSEGLDYTAKQLKRPRGPGHHVSGRELLEGIRAFALREFGPLARTVLKSWGIERTGDFGEIVFNLVEIGKLGKTDQDKREDFVDGYDFEEAFTRPFLPEAVLKRTVENGRGGDRQEGRGTSILRDGSAPKNGTPS